MKKRKGLMAIIIICVISFVATIALGIACLSTMVREVGSGRLERAWYEFAQRYDLYDAFSVVDDFDRDYDYNADGGYGEPSYYDQLPSVQRADAENRIDLSAVPQGSDLEISCDNAVLSVQAGDTAAAQLTFTEDSTLTADDYRFELFRAPDDLNRYLLVIDFSKPAVDAKLDVTLPESYVRQLEIDCDNASMAIGGIVCDALDADADNGSITAENITADQSIELATDNGIIQLTNPSCNGSIDCEADNGEIEFSAGTLTGYTIDASTENGNIVNNLVSPVQSQANGSLRYESPLADGSANTRLYFQTDNGNITLNP